MPLQVQQQLQQKVQQKVRNGIRQKIASSPSVAAAVEDVGVRISYSPELWAQRVLAEGLLPRNGYYRLSSSGGTSFIRPLMEQLQWKELPKQTPVEELPREATLHWCCGLTAKWLNQWRRENQFLDLMFCSCLPNLSHLHSKKLLLLTIRNYEAQVIAASKQQKQQQQEQQEQQEQQQVSSHLRFPGDLRRMPSDSYLPPTIFGLTPEELEHIAAKFFTSRSVWIAKPAADCCGRGIEIVSNRQQLLRLADKLDEMIIQKYIANPLLLDGRKCDLRVYLLLVCPRQRRMLAFYHPGYVRLSLRQYAAASSDMAVHLTNLSVAKATKEWQSRRNDSAWSHERLNAYLNRRRSTNQLPRDFVFDVLQPAIKSILSVVSRAAFPKLSRVGGCFELLGADFMIDARGQVWLLEINCHPGLIISTPLLNALKPAIVQESACIAMECIARQHAGRPLSPLHAVKNFQLLWDSDS